MNNKELREHVREIVAHHGTHSTAFQILNPGFEYWLEPKQEAVVGYMHHGKRILVGGEPIGPKARSKKITQHFEDWALSHNKKILYFGASQDFCQLLGNNASCSYIGSEPLCKVDHWESKVKNHASLRYQIHRAQNKGVEITHQKETNFLSSHLRSLLADWLREKCLPPLKFLSNPQTLDFLDDRLFLLASQKSQPVAYLVLNPIPKQKGWLAEQIVRGKYAPQGTSELLIHEAMQLLKEKGASMLSLGLAPLSSKNTGSSDQLKFSFKLIKKIGNVFYPFQNLESYKAKFRPDIWNPLFLATRQGNIGPKDLYAIAAAFSGGSPLKFTAKGFLKKLGIL